MAQDLTTKYFELCDYAYEQWKSYTHSYFEAAKPYWTAVFK